MNFFNQFLTEPDLGYKSGNDSDKEILSASDDVTSDSKTEVDEGIDKE